MIRTVVSGLDRLADYYRRYPEIAERAGTTATNDAAAHALALARRAVRKDANLSASYINDPDKLRVARKAGRVSGEAVVLANARPISLARYAPAGQGFGRQRGVTVRVKRGGASKHMRKAFLIPLKQGSHSVDTGAGVYNRGLALRLPEGQTIKNKRVAKKLKGGNTWLLYGPSVHQIFRQSLPEVAADTSNYFERRFFYQLGRGLKRG
jgi:hypothetical protein